MTREAGDSLAIQITEAIQAGDLDSLRRLLEASAGLATKRIVDTRGGSRTLLHIVTDWPGHFPNGAAMVALLAAAGADVNAGTLTRDAGDAGETPLHWAASSDDVEVLDALIDAGADVEAPGACIAGGTPLDDAVAFGQWKAARRLVARGAKTALWHAAALGLLDRLAFHFSAPPAPALYPWGTSGTESPDDVTVAFWCACHGGQLAAAEFLLERGAALNWRSPWDGLTPLDAAKRSEAAEVVAWLRSKGGRLAEGL